MNVAALYERRQAMENYRKTTVTDRRYRSNGIYEMKSTVLSFLLGSIVIFASRDQRFPTCQF